MQTPETQTRNSGLPELLAKLATYDGDPQTQHALQLLILTATRPDEIRGALWSEFDLDAAVWIIPATRTKMSLEHRVPLSRQAVELLRTLQTLSGGRDLVFSSTDYPSKSLGENKFSSALARMGFNGRSIAYDLRTLFSKVANESGWNPEVINRQLAYKETNESLAAYHRSAHLKDRKKLMQWWGDYLNSVTATK